LVAKMQPQSGNRMSGSRILDAFIPNDGQSALDLVPAEIGDYFQSIAREHGEGWRLPGGQLDLWPEPRRSARLCSREVM
jgi:hypothetical protein